MKTDSELLKKAFDAFRTERGMSTLKLGTVISEDGKFSSVYNINDGTRELAMKVISTGNTPVKVPGEALAYARAERDTMLACQNYRYANFEGCYEWEYTMRLLDYYEYPVDPQTKQYVILFVMPKFVQLREYCETHNLSQRDIITLTTDICVALDICEKNRILHRDVKPSNIFIKKADGGLRFILGDFGVAKELTEHDEPVTGIGSFKAPELFFRKPLKGFNSDIYSLGMTLFFLTTGDYAVAASQKKPPEHFDPVLKEVMCRAVEFDAEKRYAHAADILRELSGINSEIPQAAQNVVNIASRCKCLLVAGDYAAGISLAREGYLNGDPTCANLYAYATYSVNRQDPVKTAEVMTVLKEQINREDNTARCLFSLIGLSCLGDDTRSPDAGNYRRLMQFSAVSGCVIAQYYYGRWVFDGQMGFASDTKEGMKYLMAAVNNGFAPALLYLRTRLEHRDRRFEYSSEMLETLRTELGGFDRSKIAEAVVLAI